MHRLREFFNIDNPLLAVSLLCLIIFNRFTLTFFNTGHHVATPDNYYYAGVTVGGDWVGTINQAYHLLQGSAIPLVTGYGYAFTIITAWTISLFNTVGICSMHDHVSCTFILYNVVVTVAIVGLLLLTFLLIKSTQKKTTAILFLLTFLLGVPGGRGIEAANLDIILSFLYGFMLYLQRRSLYNTTKHMYPVLLGGIAGVMLQTKLFAFPIVCIFLFCSTEPLIFFISLLMTAGLITIIPIFYGVAASPFEVVLAAQPVLGPITKALYVKYTYGNNNTRAMVGAIVFSVPSLSSNALVRGTLIMSGGLLLFVGMLVLPVLLYVKELYRKIRSFSLKDRLSFPLFIVVNAYAIVAIILWPGMSYDYRFFYFLPLIYILLDTVKTNQQKWFLGIALTLLIIRSLFILHTKIWNIFFLGYIYFFLITTISVWLCDLRVEVKKKS